VNDAGEILHRALAAGATVRDKLQVSTLGFRAAAFFDPFGHIWGIHEKSPSHRSRV
jgi:uncharacterized glyoxalase superfamily protein PhnB